MEVGMMNHKGLVSFVGYLPIHGYQCASVTLDTENILQPCHFFISCFPKEINATFETHLKLRVWGNDISNECDFQVY